LDLSPMNPGSPGDTLSISSRAAGSYPLSASVIPWFSGDFYNIGFGDEIKVGLGDLEPLDQLWSSLIGGPNFLFSSFWGRASENWIFEDQDDLEESFSMEFPLGFTAEGLREQLRENFIEFDTRRALSGNETEEEEAIIRAGIALDAAEFAENLGEFEYFLTYALYLTPIDGQSQFEISYAVERIYLDPVSGELLNEAQWLARPRTERSVGSFDGPVVTSVTPSVAAPGATVVLAGSRLDAVTSVSVDGKPLTLSSVTGNSITAQLPTDLTPGTKDLVLVSSLGSVTVQSALSITRPGASSGDGSAAQPTASIRRSSETEAKLWARDVIGAGKVQFMLNGREIGWVRAVDATDPKLRVPSSGPMAGRAYFVRTARLVPGKNVLEIYVDGERVRRVSYSR
jgi:hypothetical protein